MLPTINPVIDVFTKINNHQTTLSRLDQGNLYTFYVVLIGLILSILLTIISYFKNRRKCPTIEQQSIYMTLLLILIPCVFLIPFSFISPIISRYNQINNLPLETVFSSYNIEKMERTKDNEAQFKAYLKKSENSKNID